jgi:hypothetical protein
MDCAGRGVLTTTPEVGRSRIRSRISTRQSLRVRASLISRSLWNSSKQEVSRSTSLRAIRSRTLRCPSRLSEPEATARARSSFKLREASPDHAYPRHRGSRACPMSAFTRGRGSRDRPDTNRRPSRGLRFLCCGFPRALRRTQGDVSPLCQTR